MNKINKNKVGTITALATLAGLALMFAVLIFIFEAPFTPAATFADSAALQRLYDGGTKWVTVEADELWDSDYYYTQKTDDGPERTTAYCYVLDIYASNQYILVKMPSSYKEAIYFDFTVTGKVRKPEELDTRIRTALAKDFAELLREEYGDEITLQDAETILSPLFIDMTQKQGNVQIGAIACAAAAVALGIALGIFIAVMQKKKRAEEEAALERGVFPASAFDVPPAGEF